jgi:hypothetical protein
MTVLLQPVGKKPWLKMMNQILPLDNTEASTGPRSK